LLGAGDARGAFAAMVRGAGRAPPALERMPLWYVKLMLRPFIKERQWRQIEPLLETALAEHEQVAALDEHTVDRFQTITARVVLLGGGKSRSRVTTTLCAGELAGQQRIHDAAGDSTTWRPRSQVPPVS